ncbi:MAG: hypothetical protein IJ739_03145 [Bacteroidaceae bacterium]|nr:hypothetical protein [Bacteroidaceae bacterium]
MRRFWTYLIYICVPAMCLLAVASCHDEEVEEPQPVEPGQPDTTLPRTLIIYMIGENSLMNLVAADSLEIARGLSTIGVNHRVVVYIDDGKSSRLCVGMREQPLQTVKTYDGNVCSTDSASMEQVFRDIVSAYPAEHYGLVFWSHGSGWQPAAKTSTAQAPRRSFGIDNGQRSRSNTGIGMDITTLAHVLSHQPHADFIFFDACFMQCVEVAYELRHVTDYVIASPAEIPGDGAPYENILQPMSQVPSHIEGILANYADYYTNGIGRSTYSGVELSAVRTSGLERLAEATAPHLQRLFGGRTTPYCQDVQRYFLSTTQTQYTEFYDLENLLFRHLPEEEYEDWHQAYVAAVPHILLTPTWYSMFGPTADGFCEITDLEHTGGVSVFVPTEHHAQKGWIDKYHALEWYHATGLDATGW